MNGKALILLVVAGICGLGAMFATSRMLSKKQTNTAQEMQDVLVAARDLKVEEVVKPEMVKLTQMARSSVPPGTFTSIKDVEDRWVQIKMLEGEAVLDRKLAPKGSPAGLVARIPKGMRAFAVDVNEQSGVSGFILPDHRVDVVQNENGPNNKNETETILQDVLVLASGQVFTRPEDRSIQSRTVTLAVTPEQVDILVAAKGKGTLTLALRGLNDHTEVKKKKAEPAPEVKPEAAVAPAPKSIEPPPPPPPPPPPEPAQVQPMKQLWIYRAVNNREKVMLGQSDDEPSPGAFGGAKSELQFPSTAN